MTKNKVSIIVFTYKRAMLLDALITTVKQFFPDIVYPIHIIYQYDKIHSNSYEKLKLKWNENIIFYERKEKSFLNFLKYFIRPLNLLWYIKFKWNRLHIDNFKEILDNLLKNLKTEFVLLSTDDQIFFSDVKISNEVYKTMRSNPKTYAYRLTSDIRFNGLNITEKNFFDYSVKDSIIWNCSDEQSKDFWKYNFNVDGTIYDTKKLYELINPVYYNMPSTLESSVLWESRLKGFFGKGFGTINRNSVGLQLFNLQAFIKTPEGNYNPEILRTLYENDYTLDIESLSVPISDYIFIPKEIFFKKNNKKYSYRDLCEL